MTAGVPEACDLLIEAGWVVRLDRHDMAGFDQQVAGFGGHRYQMPAPSA